MHAYGDQNIYIYINVYINPQLVINEYECDIIKQELWLGKCMQVKRTSTCFAQMEAIDQITAEAIHVPMNELLLRKSTEKLYEYECV